MQTVEIVNTNKSSAWSWKWKACLPYPTHVEIYQNLLIPNSFKLFPTYLHLNYFCIQGQKIYNNSHILTRIKLSLVVYSWLLKGVSIFYFKKDWASPQILNGGMLVLWGSLCFRWDSFVAFGASLLLSFQSVCLFRSRICQPLLCILKIKNWCIITLF